MNKSRNGLVLSGGGYRGVAHAGALKYLEEKNIKFDYIAGTSAGAIIGALYASGYSADEMFNFFKNTILFKKWSNFAIRKPGIIDTDKFIGMFEDYFGDSTFESLSKKLYISTTNIETGLCRMFEKGPLLKPLLASAAVPLFFSPVKIGRHLYVDGGIVNNFPVEPVLGCSDKILGIHTSPLKTIDGKELRNSYNVLRRAIAIATSQNAFKKFADCDLVLHPKKLNNYGLFDTAHLEDIYEIGYQSAKENTPALERLFDGQMMANN